VIASVTAERALVQYHAPEKTITIVKDLSVAVNHSHAAWLSPSCCCCHRTCLTPHASLPAGSTKDFSAISHGMAQCALQDTSLGAVSGCSCDKVFPNLEGGTGHADLPTECLWTDVTLWLVSGRKGPSTELLLAWPARPGLSSLVCMSSCNEASPV